MPLERWRMKIVTNPSPSSIFFTGSGISLVFRGFQRFCNVFHHLENDFLSSSPTWVRASMPLERWRMKIFTGRLICKGLLYWKFSIDSIGFESIQSKSLLNLSKSLSLDLGLLSGPSPQMAGVLARRICKDVVEIRETFGLRKAVLGPQTVVLNRFNRNLYCISPNLYHWISDCCLDPPSRWPVYWQEGFVKTL